jgi:signal transduction histidine kinase
MRTIRRGLSIRARVLTLLLAPLLPLLGMWAFSTTETVSTALNLFDAKTNIDRAGDPANKVVEALQLERKLTLLYVSEKAHSGNALTDQRRATDAAITDFHKQTDSSELQNAASALTKDFIQQTNTALNALPEGRASIDRGEYDRTKAMTLYNTIIDKAFGLYSSISGVDDQKLARQANTVVALTGAREFLNREDALLGGVLAAGTLTPADQVTLIQTIGAQRTMYQQAVRFLPDADRIVYQGITKGDPYNKLRALEDRIANLRPGLTSSIDPTEWRENFENVNNALHNLEQSEADATTKATLPAAYSTFIRLGVAGGLGLLIIVGLIILSFRIASSLIRRVTELRREALDLAENRLPEVVTRLRRGDQIDLASVAPPLDYGNDELGQLGDAFNEVQKTAISSAVHEADLRAGLNQVFLNISRRSQTLLHRQLALLDKMERRTTDSDDLAELFKVDHLATRMRRHAEDLVILAGATPGRGWRNPVPLADVCRAAVSEVEDYGRVMVRSLPEVWLSGRAVSDVVHLLAELLENATGFSPQDTQVQLSGQLVPNGFAIEIEDRGLGMPLDAIDQANRNLIDPPDFDPANSSRLGLFVVARLAARHGIRVTLRPSPYGGISAVTLIPGELVVKQAALPGSTPPVVPTQRQPVMAVASVVAASPVAPPPPAPRASNGTSNGTARPTALTPDGLPIRQRPGSGGGSAFGRADVGATQAYSPSDPIDAQIITPNPYDLDEPPTLRQPEQMRSMYSSFQSGLARGRRDAAAEPTPITGVPVVPSGDAPTTGRKTGRDRATETTEPAVTDEPVVDAALADSFDTGPGTTASEGTDDSRASDVPPLRKRPKQ